MGRQHSDSCGCVGWALVKEGVSGCAALNVWELMGPGSLPPPAGPGAVPVAIPPSIPPAAAAGGVTVSPQPPPCAPSPVNPTMCLHAQQGGLL